MSRTWSGFSTATSVGGSASSRSQTSGACSGGASGSITATSPPETTHVEATGGSQPTCGAHSGCSSRQIQRPGAISLTSTATTRQAIAVPQVAPLRGVNLGPSRRVSMPELRELLARAGFENVQTYVQSGNVVLTSTLTPDSLAKRLE